jgi:TRAP-type C4-dicarboxylate transport system substrate-binding protein
MLCECIAVSTICKAFPHKQNHSIYSKRAMADLAIGISKSVVEKLVNKVKTAVKEEAEKWQILQRDIIFIKDEFEMMESFLNTTGGEHMKNNQVARTWVRQVRKCAVPGSPSYY